jgi:nitrogen PTS system EIIA component
MNTLLEALQEGRLIELPENDKVHALQFLAHIIEAIPSVPSNTDVVGLVMARERSVNTALGRGWAIPHARIAAQGDLICVVGWSPHGIDYGAPDGTPVSIIAMYLVPDDQRNHYLREVSLLAKTLTTYPGNGKLSAASELNNIRDYLLDLITSAKEAVGPDARVRMIQLQTRTAAEALPVGDLSNLVIEPVTLVAAPGLKPVVLTQNGELVAALDPAVGLVEAIASNGVFQNGAWRVVKRGMVVYRGDRVMYDCLAIKGMAGR